MFIMFLIEIIGSKFSFGTIWCNIDFNYKFVPIGFKMITFFQTAIILHFTFHNNEVQPFRRYSRLNNYSEETLSLTK